MTRLVTKNFTLIEHHAKVSQIMPLVALYEPLVAWYEL